MGGGSLRAREKAKGALLRQFGVATDPQGYVNWPQENLVPGVRLEQFESDLRQGDGNELRVKFCAVHSSAALAVNAFAPFKSRPNELVLLGERGANAVAFEKRLPIIHGRRPSNLDVWIDWTATVGGNGEDGPRAVAIESKLLEYFEPKKPEFAEAYEQLKPPIAEAAWWNVYRDSKQAGPGFLDRAQLVKHYFGLRQLARRSELPTDLALLYLFWEPLNWQDVDECVRHRAEVTDLAQSVAESSIRFRWMTYSQLWQEWAQVRALAAHARNLRKRYEVGI